MSGSKDRAITDLRKGEQALLARLDVPPDLADRLMRMGFLPGFTVEAGLEAPGGGPRIYRIDGCDVALRRETASRLFVK